MLNKVRRVDPKFGREVNLLARGGAWRYDFHTEGSTSMTNRAGAMEVEGA